MFVALLVALLVATPPASPTPEPVHDRCIVPPASALDWIALGLYPEDGTELSDTWAVRSDDFENVWFVASDLDGPGMDGPDEIALWATSALDEDGQHAPGDGGVVLSVNGIAAEFSDWPEAGDRATDADDGAEDALDCAAGAD